MKILKYVVWLFLLSLLFFIIGMLTGCREQDNLIKTEQVISTSNSRFVFNGDTPPWTKIYIIRDTIGSNDFILVRCNGHLTIMPIGRVEK